LAVVPDRSAHGRGQGASQPATRSVQTLPWNLQGMRVRSDMNRNGNIALYYGAGRGACKP